MLGRPRAARAARRPLPRLPEEPLQRVDAQLVARPPHAGGDRGRRPQHLRLPQALRPPILAPGLLQDARVPRPEVQVTASS